jgi:hypothetical protein
MNIKHLIFVSFLFFFTGCKDENVESDSAVSNGKTIFSTGKNNQGVVLQDLQKSEMNGMVHGCANCHGEDGKGKFRGGGDRQTGSIAYKDLTNSALHSPAYTDALIERFLDSETKSDGTHANTGVVYVMGATDKTDLISYLKTL